MNTPQEPDWLDDLLAEVPIPDDGFTERVLCALPGRERWRSWILLGAAVLACLLSFFVLPSGFFLLEQVARVFSLDGWSSISGVLAALVTVAMILWGSLAVVRNEI